MRDTIPTKCCYNCVHGMKYAVPANKDSENYKYITELNAHKRVCGAIYRQPSYLMYEKRHCKNFEEREYLK